jgi:hypothetical protein
MPPLKPLKSAKMNRNVAQTTPQSPSAPDRGTSSYIPGLGLGYGVGSPALQSQKPHPKKKRLF